jgi:hypothetical protein
MKWAGSRSWAALLLALGPGLAADEPLPPAWRIGLASPREIAVVVHAPDSEKVRLRASPEGASGKAVERDFALSAETFQTLLLDPLEPNRGYALRAEFLPGGQILEGRVRLSPLPPARGETTPTVRLLLAGPPAPEALRLDLELAAAGLLAQAADFTLWIGHGSAPLPGDHLSAHGFARAAARPLRDPRWMNFWGRGAHGAVLGANDYGPPGAARAWTHRAAALTAFADAWPRPGQPLAGTPAAYAFTLGDLDCFVLDAFSLADGPETAPAERLVFGEAQLAWLTHALALSPARFKLVFSGRPLLPPPEDGFGLENFPTAARAFARALEEAGADGVVLVSAGGRLGELTRLDRPRRYPLHELSLGPLTRGAGPEPSTGDLNFRRVPGTLVREPHFARIEAGGPTDRRSLRLSVHRLDGTELWAETLAADELRDD